MVVSSLTSRVAEGVFVLQVLDEHDPGHRTAGEQRNEQRRLRQLTGDSGRLAGLDRPGGQVPIDEDWLRGTLRLAAGSR